MLIFLIGIGIIGIGTPRSFFLYKAIECHAIVMGKRHLGMGASSPKMRIEKRKSAASVYSFVRLG